MLSEEEARERSRAIWGPTIGPPQLAGAAWIFTFAGDPAQHRIDARGHVCCGHPGCVAKEAGAMKDAIANKRLRLQRVFQTRMGMPDRIEVLNPGGRLLASITATEGALVIVAVHGGRVVVNPPSPASPGAVTVRFAAPEG